MASDDLTWETTEGMCTKQLSAIVLRADGRLIVARKSVVLDAVRTLVWFLRTAAVCY